MNVQQIVEARKLYKLGLIDREVHERLGVPQSTLACFRLREGIPANKKPRWKREHEQKIIKAFVELIEETGRTTNAICNRAVELEKEGWF